MKKTIKILEFGLKTSNGGQTYGAVETTNGKATSWDESTIDGLEKAFKEKRPLVVFWEVNDKGYNNIKKILDEKPEEIGEEVVMPTWGDKKASPDRNTSFYVSYAKDICIALCNTPNLVGAAPKEVMALSILLVKQAIKADWGGE